jgi:pimeloyl-[acyl-carrier protein] methyl ester esterase
MPVILRFLHGWGFDAGFWGDVCRLLPQWPAEVDDRGYFGTPRTIVGDKVNVVVAHSYGTMRALRELPARCKGLVAINGFDRFGACEGSPGVAPRVLDSMIAKFDRTPDKVVADFRLRCGSQSPFGAVDRVPLREDLLALRNLDCTGARPGIPVLSLQGAADPILSPAMRETAFRSAAQVQRREHPAGGHLLPLTDPSYCAAAIRTFVEQVG